MEKVHKYKSQMANGELQTYRCATGQGCGNVLQIAYRPATLPPLGGSRLFHFPSFC